METLINFIDKMEVAIFIARMEKEIQKYINRRRFVVMKCNFERHKAS